MRCSSKPALVPLGASKVHPRRRCARCAAYTWQTALEGQRRTPLTRHVCCPAPAPVVWSLCRLGLQRPPMPRQPSRRLHVVRRPTPARPCQQPTRPMRRERLPWHPASSGAVQGLRLERGRPLAVQHVCRKRRLMGGAATVACGPADLPEDVATPCSQGASHRQRHCHAGCAGRS